MDKIYKDLRIYTYSITRVPRHLPQLVNSERETYAAAGLEMPELNMSCTEFEEMLDDSIDVETLSRLFLPLHGMVCKGTNSITSMVKNIAEENDLSYLSYNTLIERQYDTLDDENKFICRVSSRSGMPIKFNLIVLVNHQFDGNLNTVVTTSAIQRPKSVYTKQNAKGLLIEYIRTDNNSYYLSGTDSSNEIDMKVFNPAGSILKIGETFRARLREINRYYHGDGKAM